MPAPTGRDIGQLVVGSFPGAVVSREMRALAREFQLGGVILFARNVESPEQVADLSREVQTLAPRPLWVSIDQEGGRVARLRAPFTEWPPMSALGKSGDDDLARRFGRALAAELRAVGITLDYAPVLDVHTNEENPVIGDRALSEDAGAVARLGGVLIEALQAGGVAACGKHFPGHGDTSEDSHTDLPVLDHSLDRLRRVEFEPFREAVRREVAFIMTAHVLIPSLDEHHPATLSSAIVDALLRKELGFEGAVLSDDLEMRAVADRYDVPDAAVRAIAAGCDGVIVAQGDLEVQVSTMEALVHGVENGRITRARFDDAVRRMERQKVRFLAASVEREPTSVRRLLGCDAHRRIADEIARFA